ncbi:MAG TPA: ATP-binding protein [Methylomirabilota bacterium]|nr:ATP-binding protein [Methylomirabilota bacterium]
MSSVAIEAQRERLRRTLMRANTAALVVLSVLIGLAVGLVAYAMRAEIESRGARQRAIEAEAERRSDRERLWRSYLERARVERQSARLGRRFQGLDALAEAARIRPSAELRSEALALLFLTDLEEEMPLHRLGPRSLVPVYDLDLERYAFSEGGGRVVIHAADDHRLLAGFDEFPAAPVWMRFSGDGRYLGARLADGAIRVWELIQGTEVIRAEGDFYLSPDGALDFSPDSGRFAALVQGDRVRVFGLPEGEVVREFECGPELHGVRFHPDNRSLAMSEGNRVVVRDVESGETWIEFPRAEGAINKMHWSTDGRTLAAACTDGLIYLFDAESGRARELSGHDASVTHVAFNTRGDLLVSYSFDGTARLWNPGTGETLVSIPNLIATIFSRDDRRLGFVRRNDGIGRWRVARATGRRRIALTNLADTSMSAARSWSGPSGRASVEATWLMGEGMLLVEGPGGEEIRVRPLNGPAPGGGDDWNRALAMDRRGHWLALASEPRRIELFRAGLETENVAALSWPGDGEVATLRFDGRNLLVAEGTLGTAVEWDLAELGGELESLGLGWDAPIPEPEPPALLAEAPMLGHSVFILLAVFGVGAACVAGFVTLRRHRRQIHGLARLEALVARRGRELDLARNEIVHSQKMKALGTLAAGIAHDFNNLLSIIRMANRLAARETRGRSEVQENLRTIEQAVEQGKHVVRSMLGYSRGSLSEDGACSVVEVVEDTVSLLSRQFLSGIELVLELDRETPRVAMAADRLEQVLLNLIVNAAEAMEGRGRLRIGVRMRDHHSGRWVLRPESAGRFVELSLTDSGPGVPPEARARIFEPFFTTKTSGATPGTGLGLSTVYTIARQEGLGIRVENLPDKGALFLIGIPIP